MTAPEKCFTCKGTGLIGIFGNGEKVRAPVIPNGQVKVFEYWPNRMVIRVHLDTLKLWRRGLESKVEEARTELAKLEGGILHIDKEYERREAEKQAKRRPATSGESPPI